MNNNDIFTADLVRSLPPPLQNDESTRAIAEVIAEQLQKSARLIERNIIYARIDELDEKVLDVLAYDLHVDWYDYSYPIDVKRATIRDSIKIHRKLGTKYAVEKALGAVYPGTAVKEWFEYGGAPYMFRVIINITTEGLTAARQASILERVRFYKNLRSHLELISYKAERETSLHLCAYSTIANRLEIFPYLAGDIETAGAIQIAAAMSAGSRLEVYPRLTGEIETAGALHVAAALSAGSRLEIYPSLTKAVAFTATVQAGAVTKTGARLDVYPDHVRVSGP